MSKHKLLNDKGYILSKKELSTDAIKQIKIELTAKPKVNKDYGGDTESFPLYTEDKKYLYTPRYWAVNKYGPPDKTNFIGEKNKIKIKFTGNLRDNQVSITDQCLASIKTGGGGIVSVHCGGGKTTMSLYLVSKLKLKTLVLVHKTFLQDQWYERIQQFTDAKIGIIRQDKIDVEGKDIVIGMIQSISYRDYDPSILSQFGILIVDEAHHVGSKIYSKSIQKIRPKYTIGLSATPERYDGMTKIIKWFLGDIIYKSKKRINKNVAVKRFMYESSDKLFIEKKMYQNGKSIPAIQRMITNMYKMNDRTKFLVNIIDSLRNQYERKILVLSERLIHLDLLKKEIDIILQAEITSGKLDVGEVKTAFYIGKMKAYQLVEAAEADIIFATYSMAAEGLDIDRLNTLVLANPKKNVIQSIGRIMRKPIEEGGINPLIVDVVDKFSIFDRWGSVREKFYKESTYKINDYMSYNDKCISVKDYLINHKVIDKKSHKNPDDIRRAYLTHRFGESYLEFEEDLFSSENEDAAKTGDATADGDGFDYNYDPDLNKVLNVQIEYTPE